MTSDQAAGSMGQPPVRRHGGGVQSSVQGRWHYIAASHASAGSAVGNAATEERCAACSAALRA